MIHHFLQTSARDFPDKTAVIAEERRITYRLLNREANRIAGLLSDQGVNPQDNVILMMDNSIEYIAAYYGILKAGGVAVPFSNDLKPESISRMIGELEAAALISSKKFERKLKPCEKDLRKLKFFLVHDGKMDWKGSGVHAADWHALENYENSADPDREESADQLASIIYTSGSSGIPKGVMLSHGNIVANTESICQYLKITPDDIQMVVLPFFYVMGKSLLNTLVSAGGTVVLNNKFAFPASVLNQMAEEKVTLFSGVPSTYAFLLNRSPLEAYKDKLVHLRCCTQAGGHMASAVKKKLMQVLPSRTEICVMYGATEASARLAWLEPSMLEKKIDSIGKAIPGVEIKILDADGRPVLPGETGELVAAGRNIMKGYWNDPETTSKALDKNGYHTGDQGYEDKDGFIFLKGRKDSLLKVGGHRINPQEIEDAILATDLVVETAVIGVPDDLLGNRLTAFASVKEQGTDEKRILLECSKLLPKYKMPSEIRIIKMLPKNANGKIDRSRLAS